jgi:hypothetical protein
VGTRSNNFLPSRFLFRRFFLIRYYFFLNGASLERCLRLRFLQEDAKYDPASAAATMVTASQAVAIARALDPYCSAAQVTSQPHVSFLFLHTLDVCR